MTRQPRPRQVFRKRRRPKPVRWRQAGAGFLLLALGAGLLVVLMQLPERLDTLLLVSTAIANVIAGLSRLLVGLLQLLGVLLVALVAIGSLLVLVAGSVRLGRACLPPAERGSQQSNPASKIKR